MTNLHRAQIWLGLAIAALVSSGLFKVIDAEAEAVAAALPAPAAPSARPDVPPAPLPEVRASPAHGGTPATEPPSPGGAVVTLRDARAPSGATSPEPPSGARAAAPEPVRQSTPPSSTQSHPAPPSDVAHLVPPAPGSYEYERTVDQQSSVVTMTVTEAAGPAGSTTVTESGSPTGIGSHQVQSWTTTGEAVLESATAGSACTWEPPVQDLSGPLHAGAQWSTTSTCTQPMSDGSGTVTITIAEADEVVGLAQASVASRPTQVWVIERHQTATEQGPSATVTTETATSDMFAPSLGVVVYEVSRTAYPTSTGSTAYVTTVSQLTSSQP